MGNYINENECCGGYSYSPTVQNIKVGKETITKIEDVIVGHKIAKYTNENLDVVEINETITSVTFLPDNIACFKNETGVKKEWMMGGVSSELNNAATLINGLIYVPIAYPVSDTFTVNVGDPNFITTTFPINSSYHFLVFRNGVRQTEGVDFVRSGQIITFLNIFEQTELFVVDYYKQ